MPGQLVLPMGVNDAPDLDNFDDAPNRELVAYLKQRLLKRASGHLEAYSGYVLRGEASSGKSHLLTALAQWVQRCGGEAVLLKSMHDLKATMDWDHQNRTYLLDGLDVFCSGPDDERELMSFIERLKQNNASLVVSTEVAVKSMDRLGPSVTLLNSSWQTRPGMIFWTRPHMKFGHLCQTSWPTPKHWPSMT